MGPRLRYPRDCIRTEPRLPCSWSHRREAKRRFWLLPDSSKCFARGRAIRSAYPTGAGSRVPDHDRRQNGRAVCPRPPDDQRKLLIDFADIRQAANRRERTFRLEQFSENAEIPAFIPTGLLRFVRCATLKD